MRALQKRNEKGKKSVNRETLRIFYSSSSFLIFVHSIVFNLVEFNFYFPSRKEANFRKNVGTEEIILIINGFGEMYYCSTRTQWR